MINEVAQKILMTAQIQILIFFSHFGLDFGGLRTWIGTWNLDSTGWASRYVVSRDNKILRTR